MGLADRIKTLRKRERYNQNQFAEMVGVRSNTVWRWENEKARPDAETVTKIAKALDTTVAYLLGETDNPERVPQAQAKKENVTNVHFSDKNVVWVPVVTSDIKVCCGEGYDYPNEVVWEEIGRYPIMAADLDGYSWQLGSGGYHIITVEGDSMEPKVSEGDKILLADVEIRNGDLAVCVYRDHTFLRGVHFERDGVRLTPWNKDYEEILVPKDEREDLFFVAKMLGIVPPFQRLSSMW